MRPILAHGRIRPHDRAVEIKLPATCTAYSYPIALSSAPTETRPLAANHATKRHRDRTLYSRLSQEHFRSGIPLPLKQFWHRSNYPLPLTKRKLNHAPTHDTNRVTSEPQATHGIIPSHLAMHVVIHESRHLRTRFPAPERGTLPDPG